MSLGCAAVPAAAPERFTISIQFDVEPVFMAMGRSAALAVMRRDFRLLRRLGFTSVCLQHIDAADRGTVAGLARDERLGAAVRVPAFDRWVRAGILPAGCTGPTELVERFFPFASPNVGLEGVVIPAVRGSSSQDRSTSLSAVLESRGVPYALAGRGAGVPGGRCAAVIDLSLRRSPEAGGSLEAWLRQYHEALMAGCTGGLLIDRFRRLPGDPAGLVSRDVIGIGDRTAVKALLARARRWGGCVGGAEVRPVPEGMSGVAARAGLRGTPKTASPPGLKPAAREDLALARGDGNAVVTTLLERGERRFALLFNPSPDAYARGEVALPATLGGTRVGRAVEVPSGSETVAGRVVEPVRGIVRIEVLLRPGDAVLYEVF